MSYILQHVRPDNLQNWIRVNSPASSRNNPGDSWRAYLSANSGVGKTLYDMEQSFLAAGGFNTGTEHDRWNAKLAATSGRGGAEKARNYFK